jgi:hypothetical protein
MLAIRWSLLRNHLHLKMFRTLKIEGASASLTPKGGGRLALGLGGEGGVNFIFLLEREKMGGGGG